MFDSLSQFYNRESVTVKMKKFQFSTTFKKTWCGTKSGKIKRVRENGRHNYPDEA
ncbi:MAG: hypothetical protein ACLUUO_12470 [Sellimonas intestinalis]